MKKKKDRVKLLIDIILDPDAKDHEKEDAAMDLNEFDNEKAIKALIKVSIKPLETIG